MRTERRTLNIWPFTFEASWEVREASEIPPVPSRRAQVGAAVLSLAISLLSAGAVFLMAHFEGYSVSMWQLDAGLCLGTAVLAFTANTALLAILLRVRNARFDRERERRQA